MKKFAIAAALTVAGILSSSLHAQAAEARFTVPFNFVVSGKTLPAGTYRFTSQRAHLLEIQNMNLKDSALTYISLPGSSNAPRGVIVFHRYGDRYFLREVDSSVALVRGELPVSKAEKQAQRLEASVASENVTVALGN
ncbi:hypothetical protein [Silvibacterium sp.]|uniref:hypothetical protein n=1 Tax=Silvibacterium sp. TaxID=1964179 RepID=UPI0039E704D2